MGNVIQIVVVVPQIRERRDGPHATRPPLPHISRQEHRVLLYTAAGKSVPQMADLLHVRPTTVRTLQRRFTAKLDGCNQHHAACRAALLGVFDLERLTWAAEHEP
jgi:DNA-binding CsgD family transcriptional regulator